jgi:DNA-binding response OmpR family regulator
MREAKKDEKRRKGDPIRLRAADALEFTTGEKMALTITKPPSKKTIKPRVLIVDDEADILSVIADTVGAQHSCKLVQAKTLTEAKAILETQPIDLLVTDLHLPDGDGLTLLPMLRREQPNSNAIVISGSGDVDGAITALRNGAVDFLKKPFSATELSERVGRALRHQAATVKSEKRIDKLRHAVRRLNEARKVVTKKVDLLCNDLISAYGELSKQLEYVRTQEGFKHYLGEMKDLEQLLCHTMDYLMRQMGYSNIAIWLAGDEAGQFQLGAYMKYTMAGEADLTDAMRNGIVKMVDRESFVHLSGEEADEVLTPAELDFLGNQEILATNCTYLGETLGVVVLFRDASKGFGEVDVATLKTISPLFALSLASVVREAQQSEDGEGGVADDDRDRSSGRDDWWKNGEAPPF